MARLSVRLTERTIARLDELARQRGKSRSDAVRQLVEAALGDVPAPDFDPPGEDELLELLAEKARQGNVGAIRALLVREQQLDPKQRALLAFEQLAAGREQ